MRTPRRPRAAALLAAAAVCGLALAATATGAPERVAARQAQAWRSAFVPRGPLDLTGRVVVVLAAPSLADRAAGAGGLPSARAQRTFVRRADALQRRLVASLRERGVRLRRAHVYTRVLNGFSATVDARALAALEQAPGVAGVYPVRAIYPAELRSSGTGPADVAPPALSLPGSTGRGVTVALLDSGVDRDHPALRGRVAFGVDLVDGDSSPVPGRLRGSGEIESHGTRVAGLVAGRETGVAPGALILPIRVLGWQRSADGTAALAGTSDLLLAGLERAVDPDGDGDVEDAARIALAALVEPYAAFADSPETRAVEGASALGTLVVAAAGNDGPGGTGGPGTVGSPASAGAALAVGAADLRSSLPRLQLTVRAGDRVLAYLAARVLGGTAPRSPLTVPATVVRGPTRSDPAREASLRPSGSDPGDLVSSDGQSLVAGQALVIPADGSPLAPRLDRAARSGAAAVIVYGSALPAGALGGDGAAAVPALAVPARVGAAVERALADGQPVQVTLQPAASPERNDAVEEVAAFSSGGTTYDGRPKPDVVAAGVGLPSPDVGSMADGSARYALVNGTSAAAALAAGAAALVASSRPELDASELRAVLVGSARPLAGSNAQSTLRAGAGLIDPVAADAAEVIAEPSTIAAGRSFGPGFPLVVPVRVRNVSVRPLHVSLGLALDHGAEGRVAFAARPAVLDLAAGGEAVVDLLVQVRGPGQDPGTLSGVVVLAPEGGPPARVPWAVLVGVPTGRLVQGAKLTVPRLVARRGDAPAFLEFTAGGVVRTPAGNVVEPVGRLDVELWRGERLLGTIARFRDLLPGRYSVAITGRGPAGGYLRPGRYRLVLRGEAAAREGAAGRSVVSVPFAVGRPSR